MGPDLTIDLINATVQIEQPASKDKRTVGTGFLVDAPAADGHPRVVLVTAAHVLELMAGDEVRVGWRFANDDGGWRYAPASVTIRDHGKPLWTRNPDQDVAVLALEVPPEFAKAAIPLAWLADEHTFEEQNVGPGDEMMTLGFPQGMSSNHAGFPILRTGRIASYPVAPLSAFPTFLIDLRVLPGNSGGPVFMTHYSARRPDTEHEALPVITGVLTKQVELEIGVVAHAQFVRDAIKLLDAPAPGVAAPAPNTAPGPPPGETVSDGPAPKAAAR